MIAQTSVGQSIVLCGLPAAAVQESGTGPRPMLFRGDQPRLNGIALDIPDHFIQFSRRTNPTIVGLILPRRLPAAAQNAIRDPAGSSLKPTHNVRHRDPRLPNCVQMVWHNGPDVQVVGADGCTMLQSVLNHSGDSLVPQPERPPTAPVEPLIANVERNAACVFGGEELRRGRRSGPGKAPSYKDDASIRKPMRKVAAIKKHIQWVQGDRPQKTMVRPTARIFTKI
jgi:hypothetical protein